MSEKHVICVSFAQVFRHLLGLSASAIDAGRDMIVCGLRSVRIYVFPLQRDRVMELHSALSLFIIYMCNTFPFTKKSFF